jgi:hypothetical protein
MSEEDHCEGKAIIGIVGAIVAILYIVYCFII